MNTILWKITALSLLVTATIAVGGATHTGDGADTAIGRADASQREHVTGKDLVADGHSAASPARIRTWNRLMNDEALRKLLQDETFRALVSDSRRFKIVDDPDAIAAFRNTALQEALRDPGFTAALRDPRFADAIAASTECPAWYCAAAGPGADVVASTQR